MSAIHALTAVADHVYVLNNGQEQLNLQTLIGNSIYSANITKRLIIPSGIVVGSSSSTTAALIIPAGAQGRLIIENYGTIQGAGGAGGTSNAGGDGGDAIFAGSACIIANRSGGIIYAGGGGGGRGGTGGTGGQGSFITYQYGSPQCGSSGTTCSYLGSGWYCPSGVYQCALSRYRCNSQCQKDIINYTTGGVGGAGGSGGRGRGYDGTFASGSSGAAGAAGGTNAGAGGTGGTGGTGGDWGSSGSSGSTGSTGANGNFTNGLAGIAGSSGGLAGYYINGLSTYVTFTNNGTVAGRSN